MQIQVIPLRGNARDIEPWTGTGGHGGGDDAMLLEIFGDAPADKFKRKSDERAGAYSILVGVAANQCFETGKSVRIADMGTGLTPPEQAPMPMRIKKA